MPEEGWWMWLVHSLCLMSCFVIWLFLLADVLEMEDEVENTVRSTDSEPLSDVGPNMDEDYEDQGGLFIHAMQRPSHGWPFFHTSLAQDNPQLIQFLRKVILFPPSASSRSYSQNNPMTEANSYPRFGKTEAETLPLIFGDPPMKNGTFFEAGGSADADQWLSTTRYMERILGWSGLVAEMVPKAYHSGRFLSTNRGKAWFAPACLSPKPYPTVATYRSRYSSHRDEDASILGKEGAGHHIEKHLITNKVPCFPLYSLLVATNLTTLDLCSLNSVDGIELEVLRTLPWEKVDIKVFSLNLRYTREGVAAVHEFLSAMNYRRINRKESSIVFTYYVRTDWA